jgi:hypothetical protein
MERAPRTDYLYHLYNTAIFANCGLATYCVINARTDAAFWFLAAGTVGAIGSIRRLAIRGINY